MESRFPCHMGHLGVVQAREEVERATYEGHLDGEGGEEVPASEFEYLTYARSEGIGCPLNTRYTLAPWAALGVSS